MKRGKKNLLPFPPDVQASAAMVLDCTALRPRFGVVLGSGLAAAVDAVAAPVIFPRESLYGFPPVTVAGNSGDLALGKTGDVETAVFRGRAHLYEGFGADTVLAAVRLFAAIGVKTLLLTNAAGGLSRRMHPGDWMIIEDHIDLTFGICATSARAHAVYDRHLSERLEKCLLETHQPVKRGVYVGLTGPTYETPAEITALRAAGGDAVGMSTVWEAAEARRLGMCVAGLSCITNSAVTGPRHEKVTHEEVLTTASRAARGLAQALPAFVKELSTKGAKRREEK